MITFTEPTVRPDLPPEATILEQFHRILNPLTRSSRWTTSRLGVYSDSTMAPILQVLAQEKFGLYDPTLYMAYWRDANWSNETWANVSLCRRSGTGVPGRPAGNKTGFPAGTPEYWRAYRAARQEKVKEWSLRAREKRRAILDQLAEETALAEVEALLRPKHLRQVDPSAVPKPSVPSDEP
jgi:hypothetical protein